MSVGGGPISGLGKVPMWGHSPAIDFLEYLKDPSKSDERTIRILLVGQADLRHVLKTLTKNFQVLETEKIILQFYMAEDFPEVLGRQMLFLLLAIQRPSEIGLQEKGLQFLELFGNTLIRPKTRKTFLEMSDKLIELTGNPTEGSVFDLSDLKFREKDDLIEIFNHWKSFAEIFPIQDNWTKRLEKHLGVRYDARQNVFDWDYNMRLAENGPCVVSFAEYKKWRNSGIAFADFDSEYSQSNVSLTTGIASGGGAFLSYRGEIVTGPFIPFGIEADDASLFEMVNGRHKSTAYDISMHNIQRAFSAIASLEKPLSNILRVTFLSPSNFGRPRFLSKFGPAFFDAAFVSTSSAQYLIPPITELLKPEAPVIVEDTRYLLELRPEQRTLYREKVVELAAQCSLELVESTEKSAFIEFVKMTSVVPDQITTESGDVSCPEKVKLPSSEESATRELNHDGTTSSTKVPECGNQSQSDLALGNVE